MKTQNGNRSGGPKPVHRITRDKVEAAIWERQGKQGRFFQVSFSRPYQTADGSIGSSECFGVGQCSDVVIAAVEAALWMESQRRPRERRRDADDGYEATEPDFDGDANGYDSNY